MKTINNIYNSIRLSSRRFIGWLQRLSLRDLILLLVVVLIILAIVNYLISSVRDVVIEDPNENRVRITNNQQFYDQVISNYPQLSRRLPYLGENCRINLERDEQGEKLVIFLDIEANSEDCGATLFLKQNARFLNGIRVEEKEVDFSKDV